MSGLEDLRGPIHKIKLPGERRIWIDEIDHPREKGVPAFVTLSDLFRLMRESEIFIVLLAGERHGSNLDIAGNSAHVSYWESELFYAALMGKPVHVFEAEGFRPEPKLALLLEMLKDALPVRSWFGPLPRASVSRAVHKFLLDQISSVTPNRGSRRIFLGRLVDGLIKLRGRAAIGGDAERDPLPFDWSFHDTTVVPNESLVKSLLKEVSSLSNEEAKLARLWIVYRELCGIPIHSKAGIELLPYWNRFLSEWASAGSWYGLHGHARLTVLPALVKLAQVRARMRDMRSSAWQAEDMRYPAGGLASSRYSIAGYSGSFMNRRRLLRAALADINHVLGTDGPDADANLLAIRGSVYRRLGAIWAAVADYKEVLRHRENGAGSPSEVGQAMAELGYGYLFEFRLRHGLSLLKEGVRLMSENDTRAGFIIRAKRKLAAAYMLNGQLSAARLENKEAHDLAVARRVFDQISR